MDDIPAMLKALSDETRLSMLTILLNHDICTGAVARRMGITDAAVSQHMRVLREAGLVEPVRRGYFIHYTVDTEALSRLGEYLCGMTNWARAPCDPDLEGCPGPRRGRCSSEKCTVGCPRRGGDRCPGCSLVLADQEMRR